jgi:hypothetical protein
MFLRKAVNNRVLFMTGSSLVALQIVARVLIGRTIGANDGTDFVMGVLLGVGLGLLLLCLWRLRRDHERLWS